MRVVPPLYELEHRLLRLFTGSHPHPIDEFALQGGEEGLAHRIIIRVADTSHRRLHAGLSAPVAEGNRSVLAAVVGVMHHGPRLALANGHLQRRDDQLRAQMHGESHPTTRRLQACKTTATYRKPVGTSVMSATQRRFGPWA